MWGTPAALTSQGIVLGSAAYLAPEQARGERATPAADIYALGVVAFQMITGRRPFEGESVIALLDRKLREPAPSIREFRSDLPRAVDDLIRQTLDRDLQKRPATAGLFATRLTAALTTANRSTGGFLPGSSIAARLASTRLGQRRWLAALLLPAALIPAILIAAGQGPNNSVPASGTRPTFPLVEAGQTAPDKSPTPSPVASVTSTVAPSLPASGSQAKPVPPSPVGNRGDSNTKPDPKPKDDDRESSNKGKPDRQEPKANQKGNRD